MRIDRRRFLGWLGAAVPLGTLACEAGTTALSAPDARAASDAGALLDAAAPLDAGAAADAAPLPDADAPPDAAPLPDGGALLDAGEVDAGGLEGAVVIGAPFDVILYDPSCSRHSHSLRVEARAYAPGAVTRYLGGSHTVALTSNEIAQLAAGEAIPFATVGDFPSGHGHCGLAHRSGRPTDTLPAAVVCTPAGTAACLPR